jgi:MFS family permease
VRQWHLTGGDWDGQIPDCAVRKVLRFIVMSMGKATATPDGPALTNGRFLLQGLSAFKHRNYRLFFFGQLISVIGTWMQTTAQAWLVTDLTSSAFRVALVAVFQFLPVLFLSLVGGMIADRLPKRNLLVFTQIASALLAAILAVLVWTDRVELWQVYVLALCLGIVNSFDLPARQAFVVDMVGKGDLVNAVALNSALFNAARIVGPAIAGILIATVGVAICFAFNAVSYIAVIVGLLMMRLKTVPRATNRGGLAEMREGIAYVRTTPVLLLPIILVGFVATFGMNFNVWIPLLAKHELKTGAGEFGALTAALGVGSLIGALVLAFMGKRPQYNVMISTAALLGLANLVLAIAGAIPLAVGVALAILPLNGFAMTTTMAMANSIVQTESRDELRGRVMSVYMMVFGGTAPFGALLAGLIASALGTPASIAIGGLVTFAAAIAVSTRRHLAVSPELSTLARSADD